MANWLTQTCAHCGKTYTPKRSDSLYCTPRCRVAAHRAKQPTAALVVACAVCGKEFEAGRAGARQLQKKLARAVIIEPDNCKDAREWLANGANRGRVLEKIWIAKHGN